MKSIISLFLLLTVSCQFKGKLFDVEQFLSKDLNDFNGYPVNLEICDDQSNLKVLKNKVTPPEIEWGQDVTLKSQVLAMKKLSIQKLKLITKYNGSDIFTDERDFVKEVEESEKFVYTYTASVPSFTPAGEWDIYLHLVDADGNKLSCLKAHFTTS